MSPNPLIMRTEENIAGAHTYMTDEIKYSGERDDLDNYISKKGKKLSEEERRKALAI